MTTIKGKRASESAIEDQIYKIFPNDLNSNNTVFGGIVMAEQDRITLVVAERHSGHFCVTASVSAMHFLAPAKRGDTLIFKATVNRTWQSSMEIGIKTLAENSFTGTQIHIVSAYFTFFALDEGGKPTAIPPLILTTDDEKRRYEEAEQRKQMRISLAQSRLKK